MPPNGLPVSSEAVASASVAAYQEGRADALEVASIAKSWVGDAGIALVQGCFQIFGGIGYTWEHDLHLWMTRAWALAAAWGDPSWHRARVADALLSR